MTKRLILCVTVGLLLTRLFTQYLLYQSGFMALTADDFGRIVMAAQWANDPHLILHGIWLPIYMYLFGAALWLHWDLLWVPRLISTMAGLISIVCMIAFTRRLFGSTKLGLISALLLMVNPVHLWLSAVPLTEMLDFMFVLIAILSLTNYLLTNEISLAYLSSVSIGIANGLRQESWIITSIHSLFLFRYLWFNRSPPWSTRFHFLALIGLAWLFPSMWIIGNCIETGDPLFFLTAFEAYQSISYGSDAFYYNYLSVFLKIDPFATILSVIGLLLCFRRKEQEIRWFLAVNIIPFALFALLQRGQVLPEGTYFRYLSRFIFLSYPATVYALDMFIQKFGLTPKSKQILWRATLLFIIFFQLNQGFQFNNDPSSQGLVVGQYIQTMRTTSSELQDRPILIELVYWDYLAIHVGANDDFSTFLYDRPLRFGNKVASSLLLELSFLDTIGNCLVEHDLSYIIVKSPQLKQAVAYILKVPPSQELNGFTFYPVPNDMLERYPPTPGQNCPLVPGTGYD